MALNVGEKRRPSAIFYSQIKNAPSLTAFDTFGSTIDEDEGRIIYSIAGASYTFTKDTGGISFTALSTGTIPTISTAAYFMIKADFSITKGTQNPTISDFTVNWFEGNASDKIYGTYFDDSIMFSLASGAGATTNNRVLKFDILNQGWTIWDWAANGFFTKSQALYFADATAGYIHKYGDRENDNGTAIEAYWKSKDFVHGDPYVDKTYTDISLFTDSEISTGTVTYQLDASSTSTYSVYLYDANSSYMKFNRNLPIGKIGGTFNVKFGNDASDQPFEIFGIRVGFRSDEWRETP